MIDSYKISTFKSGVDSGVPHWLITFDGTDFQSMTGFALIEGPVSILIDVDATLTKYPIYCGIEVTTIERAISIADSPQIGFIPRSERKLITPGSVPQLAYITGTISQVIIHCYGYAKTEAPLTKVSIRIGPPAPFIATGNVIGRATMANEPGFIATLVNSTAFTNVAAGSVGTTIASYLVTLANGIRIKFKSIQVHLSATPSYSDDLMVYLSIIDRAANTYRIARVFSSDERIVSFTYPSELILDVGYTLMINADNRNTTTTYSVGYDLCFEGIY